MICQKSSPTVGKQRLELCEAAVGTEGARRHCRSPVADRFDPIGSDRGLLFGLLKMAVARPDDDDEPRSEPAQSINQFARV